MAKPVISTATSILLGTQGTQIAFQPAVTSGTPTAWYAPVLPPGLSIVEATGLIVGVPTTQYIGTIKIRCKNSANEYSDWILVSCGITPSTLSNIAAVTLNVDIDTAVVWSPEITESGIPPLFGKTGDRILVLLGFMKQGVLQDVGTIGIKAFIRGDVDGRSIHCNTDTFMKVGAYSQTRYLIQLDFAKQEVKDLLESMEPVENSPGAPGRHVFPWIEFELTYGTNISGVVTYGTRTSRSVNVMLSQELG